MGIVKSSRPGISLEAVAWGALLVWWGVTELVPGLPKGTGAVGVGLILLGVNAVRRLSGAPILVFSTILGALALVWGGLDLAASLLSLPFEMPTFAILLIVLGAMLLGRELVRNRTAEGGY
jgi:hypothetical protein